MLTQPEIDDAWIAMAIMGWTRVQGREYPQPSMDGWGRTIPGPTYMVCFDDEWAGSESLFVGRLKVSRAYKCGPQHWEPTRSLVQALIVRGWMTREKINRMNLQKAEEILA